MTNSYFSRWLKRTTNKQVVYVDQVVEISLADIGSIGDHAVFHTTPHGSLHWMTHYYLSVCFFLLSIGIYDHCLKIHYYKFISLWRERDEFLEVPRHRKKKQGPLKWPRVGRVTSQVSMRRRFVEVRMAPIDIGWNEVFNGYYDLRCILMVFNCFFNVVKMWFNGIKRLVDMSKKTCWLWLNCRFVALWSF